MSFQKLERSHSGSTLINLCLTGTSHEAWEYGTISNVIGDKSTGKTLLALESCNYASLDNNCDVIFIDVERSVRSEERLKQIGIDLSVSDINFITDVSTIEDFEKFIEKYLKTRKHGDGKKAFIVLDSYDGLTSETEETNKAGYGTERTKMLSKFFRKFTDDLRDMNIHLQIISQVRENLNATMYQPQKIRTGGKSLGHAVASEMWITQKSQLKSSDDLTYGIEVNCNVTKSRLAKPNRKVNVHIIYDRGLDDVRSCVLWLKDVSNDFVKLEGAWWSLLYKKEGAKKESKKFRFDDLVRHIEQEGLYPNLVDEVEKQWSNREVNLEEKVSKGRVSKMDLFQSLKKMED